MDPRFIERLAARGPTARLIAALDWSGTSLGPIDAWPPQLKTVVDMMIDSTVPMTLLWGRKGHLIYNDGYAAIAGGRHPGILGLSARAAWPEAAAFNGEVLDSVFAGRPLTFSNQEFSLNRDGIPAPVWLTLDYSPVKDDEGEIAGVLALVHETTELVRLERHLAGEQSRLKQMFQQAPTFMAMLSGADHVIEFVNPGYLKLVGHRAVLGRTVAEALPDAAAQGYVGLLDRVFESGKPYSATGSKFAVQAVPHGPVVERFVDFVYQPLTDGGNTVIGIFVEGVDVTDRVTAEAEVRQNRDRLDRTLADARIIGTWDWHVAEDRLTADERFAHMHGLDPTAVRSGVSAGVWFDSIHPVERARVIDQLTQAMARNESLSTEYRVLSPSFGTCHVLVRGRCELPEDAAPGRFSGVIVDITEQRRSGAALRDSEAQLQLVSLGARDHAIFTTDSGGGITSWSAGAESIFGWSADEMRGRNLSVLFTLEDRERGLDRQEMAAAALEGQALDERWHLRKDGELVYLNGSMYALRSGDEGTIRGFLKIARNETARRRAEVQRTSLVRLTEDIRELEDPVAIGYQAACILGEALQVSRVGYGSVDSDREVLTVGRDWRAPGIESLAGELSLRNYGSFIDSLKRNEFLHIADVRMDARTRAAAQALESRSSRAFINVPIVEHGRLMALLFINHNEVREWTTEDLAFIREVAQRTRTAVERARAQAALRDSEAQLRQANETLESQVMARTAELMQAEEALRQSQKMEAVGQLTGGLAHDFNNLLGAISGSLELLEKRMATGRLAGAERFIEAAQSASRRAASLTQRLLAFSRRQTLDPKPTDVNRLIGGMEELVRRSVGPNVRVEIVGSAGLWLTRVDASQLESSLLNLCINARDAMAPDGGRLTIESANKWLDERAARERDLVPGQYVSLCVSDTGTGMTRDVIARAFDPFFTTKPLGLGTGLGLSMVYGFARQSGGQIRVYSEVGKGTTMCLYLPRFVGELAEDEVEREPHIDQGDGERILVVDDEATIRMLIVEVLEEHGYSSIEAADGPSALKVLQSQERIDLLVTDVGLPGGINGRQVADAARIMRPRLKVLFITGFAENAAVGNGDLEAGMEVMTKPFLMSALGSKIRELVERR